MNLVTKVAHTSYHVHPPLGRRLKNREHVERNLKTGTRERVAPL